MDAPDRRVDCPFCNLPDERVVDANAAVVVIRDGYPVSEGHTLIVPRRHVASGFDLTGEEWAAIHAMLGKVREDLDQRYLPDGYNIGINVGQAAGQTVWHVHVHVIPRHAGDVENPRGGVRNVIPGKGDY